uniref:Uncharacterized protein n=1 Tax=Tanacetum cinerariifolium TaxID=118510 RepID=A0A699GDW2_TANCI|nr:hypothetical protein [Tanacetum cinerariifolium]
MIASTLMRIIIIKRILPHFRAGCKRKYCFNRHPPHPGRAGRGCVRHRHPRGGGRYGRRRRVAVAPPDGTGFCARRKSPPAQARHARRRTAGHQGGQRHLCLAPLRSCADLDPTGIIHHGCSRKSRTQRAGQCAAASGGVAGQSQLRQDRAVQPPDRRAPEGGQLRRCDHRAQGRRLQFAGRPHVPRARPAGRLQPHGPHPGRSHHARRGGGPAPGRRRAGRAGVRGQRHQPAPEPAPGAGSAAPGPAHAAGPEHGRRRQKKRHRHRYRAPVAGTGHAGGGNGGRAAGRRKSAARRARRHAAAAAGRRQPAVGHRRRVGGRDPARSAPHHCRRRHGRRRSVHHLRKNRQRGAAPGARSGHFGRADVPRVPGRVQLGRHADGPDHGRLRAPGRHAGRAHGRRPPAQPAGGRHRGRRRRRAGVPAADSDPVLLHLDAGRLRLPAARGVPARPPDGRRGPVGPRLHSAAVEFCLRHSRRDGRAHHSEPARPLCHHHDRAADDVFGAAARVRAGDCRLHSQSRRGRHHEFAGAGAVHPVRGRHRLGHAGGVGHEAHHGRQGQASADDGAARLPLAAPAQPGAGPVGTRQDFYHARGHHHPQPHHHPVGTELVPRCAARRRSPGHLLQPGRHHRPRPRVHLRAHRFQLADLHCAGAGHGCARSGGRRAGHRVCDVADGRRAGAVAGAGAGVELGPAHGAVAAGVVRVRTAVPSHLEYGPPGNQQRESCLVHGRLFVCAGVRGGIPDVPYFDRAARELR